MADRPDVLSRRERQVFGLLVLGHTNSEIAERLFLSVRTVESHRANLFAKLDAGTRKQVVSRAHILGLLETV